MTMGKKLEVLRRAKGLTQEALASILNVSRQTIYKWEQNITSPSYAMLKKIIDYFDVSYDDLLRDTLSYSINFTIEDSEYKNEH